MTDLSERLTAALADRYRIERELGQGGMATVYLAHDVKHDRSVALKVLRPELAAILGAERFLNEIKVTANLQHPNILALYDSGEADTFLYYVMPYVEGETLRQRMDRERQLSVEDALQIAREIAAALEFAHQRNVVHRDIKPENILFQGGQAVVADFGIALAVSQAGGTRLTETGLSLGTPHYMSPEQATGDRELDARSDIYSLGAVVYEMLTGEPPHAGKSVQAIVAKILSERPSPITRTRDLVPPNVDAAVQKALAKSPADRFTSSGNFAEALANPSFTLVAAAPTPSGEREALRARGRSPLVPILATTTIAATAAAAWLALAPTEKPVRRFRWAFPGGQELSVAAISHRIAVSPDGERIAYVGPGGASGRVWVRDMERLDATPLPGTEGGTSLSFSPDGERIAFVVGTGTSFAVRVTSVQGAPPITLTDSAVSGGGLAWSADDYLYFDAAALGIMRIRSRGGTPEQVLGLDSTVGEVGFAWPEVLPNGNGLIARRRLAGQTTREHDVIVLDLRTGDRKVLARAVGARYATSGHLLYVTWDGTLYAAPFDQDKLEVTGDATPVAAGLRVGGFGAFEVSLSREGTLVYTAGSSEGVSRLSWRGRDGGGAPVDPNWPTGFLVRSMELSPDGGRLAFDAFAPEVSVVADVFVKQLDRGPNSRLTFNTAAVNPVWSADGRSVLYISAPDSSHARQGAVGAVYAKPADGSGPERLVTAVPYIVSDLATVPGSRGLILHVDNPVTLVPDLLLLESDSGAAPVDLLSEPNGEQDPAVSPDGRWLAYVSNESGRSEVFVRPFPNVADGRSQVSINGGQYPRWSRDGRELYYVDPLGVIVATQFATEPTFRVLEQEMLFTLQGMNLYDVASDGRFLVLESADAAGAGGDVILVQNFFEELRRTVGR
jgi:serine/threonine-protein kinase